MNNLKYIPINELEQSWAQMHYADKLKFMIQLLGRSPTPDEMQNPFFFLKPGFHPPVRDPSAITMYNYKCTADGLSMVCKPNKP